MFLPYMFLQYEGNKPDIQKASKFLTLLQNEEIFSIKVGDFKKKSSDEKIKGESSSGV